MKKNMRSLVASVLAVLMLVSLAACGGGSDKPGQQSSGQTGGKTGGKSGDHPEFVYVSSFREVENDNKPIAATCFTETGFYSTSSDVVGRREPEEGETEQWEGQFDITRGTLYFETYDGTRTKLENYAPLEFDEVENHDVGCELFSLAADTDGSLAAVYRYWDNWNDAPEGISTENPEYWSYSHYDEGWYIRTMDKSGSEIACEKLNTSESDWFWVNGLCYVGGKILINGGSGGLMILNTDGTSAGKITPDGWINNVFTLRDGTPCITYGDNMTGEMKIAAIDPDAGRVTQTWRCPRNAYTFMTGGGDYDLYYQSGINLYGYDLESESSERLFDWLNADVLSSDLTGFTFRPDGTVFGVINSWDSKWENVTTEFVTLEKKPFADVPQKESLTLACQWADSPLQSAIIKFNRSSNIRINVIDYSQYNTDEDYSAGLTKLTTEIMSGSMPDILMLRGLPYQQLAAKGLLEDLYPYLDADSELSRDDFLPNVLSALEENGKLCSTVTTFNIVTLVGAASVVGDQPGWSFEDVRTALASMPEGCTVLDQFTTSGDILRAELTLDADYYIDWESGKVNFDSKEFVDLLNFSRLFPNAFDYANYNWDEYTSDDARIRDGKQLLSRMYLSSFDDILMTEAQFGGNMTYIGYPTASGVGSYLNLNSGYAMSSRCADKDAAWQFLRSFMTEKALESNYYWGFPANRKLLDKQLKEAMTVEYLKDENGNYLLDENGERIPQSRGGFWSEGMSEPMEYYSLTQEQADKVMAIINSTTKIYSENTAVLNIIFEQTDAFFSGQKTAEEVAKLVQGKLSIYVNEQR